MRGTKYSTLPPRAAAAARKREDQLKRWQWGESTKNETPETVLLQEYRDYNTALARGIIEPGSSGDKLWRRSIVGKYRQLRGRRGVNKLELTSHRPKGYGNE